LQLTSQHPGQTKLPATLFEFRLRLLTGWLTGNSWPSPDDVGAAARDSWDRFSFPDRCVRKLAEIGLGIRDVPDLDQLIVALLREAHHQAANVEPDDDLERKALVLLMKYQPAHQPWRDLYVNVCRELDDLLKRESAQMRDSDDLSVVQLALLIQAYLEPLEDPELRAAYYARATPAVKSEERQTIVTEAELRLASGEMHTCWNLLHDHLAWAAEPPPGILQLRFLDVARRCADKDPSLDGNVGRLTEQLQRLLRQYAHRFVKTVSGSNERRLAQQIERRVMGLFEVASSAKV
jgi:hypothetical protein